jgi:hypothetical protein
VAEEVRYFLDASLQKGVCIALTSVRDDAHPWRDDCPVNPGDKDEKWLPVVGGNDWVVILRDKRLRSRPHQRQALIDYSIRTFCLTGAGNLSKWGVLVLLVRNWDRIAEVSDRPGPFVCSITTAGIRDLSLSS